VKKEGFVVAAAVFSAMEADRIITLLKVNSIPAYKIGGATDMYTLSASRTMQEIYVPEEDLELAKQIIGNVSTSQDLSLDDSPKTPRSARVAALITLILLIAGIVFSFIHDFM
jgi:hypothetical protein